MEKLPDSFSQALNKIHEGENKASEELWTLVYAELKRMARRKLGFGFSRRTLSSTTLVHEVYLRIGERLAGNIKDRQHFMALSARAMRQIITQHARSRAALKRSHESVPFDDELLGQGTKVNDFLVLDGVLEKLESADEKLVRVVECRFFGGLTNEETATALSITSRTVERHWTKARMFLSKALESA